MTSITRRLANLEQAAVDERPKEPMHIDLVALDDKDELQPHEPWVPGSSITRIALVSLRSSKMEP
jgi:hypothetical protein